VEELVDPERGRVHLRVYTDEALFRDELRKIFYTTWVYVGHESEIAHVGDYKTTFVGLVPVIVVRSADGLAVLVNRCSHRGATVCQLERGTAQVFRCEYHAWTYALGGRLIGISRQGGYAPEEIAEFNGGLQRLPRVAAYRGLIFASFAADGPSLEEHLGNARPYLDDWADLSPSGDVVFEGGIWKNAYRGNWKLQVEGSNEGYHPEFLHRAAGAFRIHMGTGKPLPWFETTARGIDLGNGHSLMEFPANFFQYPPAYVELLEQRLGPERAAHVLASSWRMSLFPNVSMSHNDVRVVRPLAVDRTEVRQYHVALAGVPDEMNVARIRYHEGFYGPAGTGSADDLEIFERIQEGARSVTNEDLDPWVWFNRGVRSEIPGPGGERIGHTTSEVEQRAFYRAWSTSMKGAQVPAAAS
jgi:phenylpropionate dioxygenase-like ring-hydroxylating dioxygenase large terminal subunit